MMVQRNFVLVHQKLLIYFCGPLFNLGMFLVDQHISYNQSSINSILVQFKNWLDASYYFCNSSYTFSPPTPVCSIFFPQTNPSHVFFNFFPSFHPQSALFAISMNFMCHFFIKASSSGHLKT